MVAVIHSSKSLRNILNYNENKVKQKVAQLIHAGNYPKDVQQLSFSDKINRLQRLALLNQQAKINSVHISLNFDNADRLNNEKLKAIADEYLEKIGFAQQPYLVYQHTDAAHPHLHIVTTNIQADGSRISLHNLGRNQSEKARKELEKKFCLLQAQSGKINYELTPLNAQKIQYGKSETKRAITNVLNYVLPTYKYASLAELNAVLRQYNIVADRGKENSRMSKNNGLVYRILGDKGKKIGVPIKASIIYNKPTLKNIEANFERNEKERQQHKQHVMNAIDLFFMKHPFSSLEAFIKAVQKENIQVVLRQNDIGIIYGITYIDHHTKCVFNGSHLGKQYSANAIQQRLNHLLSIRDETASLKQSLTALPATVSHLSNAEDSFDKTYMSNAFSTLRDDLIQPQENLNTNEPFELKKFKRKRKQKHPHH